MQFLKQSVASTINIGPFIDDTDFKTRKTALTVTNMTVKLFKHSDISSASNISFSPTASGGSNDCIHVANAIYNLELTATDSNTLGRLSVDVVCSGTLGTTHDFEVISVASYDLLVSLGLWETLLSSLTTIGSVGKLLVDNLDTNVGSRSTPSDVGNLFIESGIAQAGSNNTITLATGSNAINQSLRNCIIYIKSGTGAGQFAYIINHNASTKVVTIFCKGTTNGAWVTNPASGSVYVIVPPSPNF